MKESIDSKRYLPTTNKGVVADSEVILICVPTPLSSDHKPDLGALTSAITTVGKNLKAGALLIVESTIEPGTCRNILLPILIKESGLKASDIELAYSPERIDPTNKKWSINNTPKLVAALTESAALSPDINTPKATILPNNTTSKLGSCNCNKSGIYRVLNTKNPANKNPAISPDKTMRKRRVIPAPHSIDWPTHFCTSISTIGANDRPRYARVKPCGRQAG
ncbi:MAG: hypothetical protein EB015_16300 [Methylocystaceae bacterium]|nr:hypothetical protein [Methylocystaceae bacterium]